jgi:hypothetical protein
MLSLLKAQQTFYKMCVSGANNTINAEVALTFLGFFGQNVTLKAFLKADFTGAGYFKTLFGTRVGFYLWHVFTNIYCDTLLASPKRLGNLWGLVGNGPSDAFHPFGGAKVRQWFQIVVTNFLLFCIAVAQCAK